MFLEDSFSSSPSESGKYKYGLLSRGQRNSIILKKKLKKVLMMESQLGVGETLQVKKF